MENLEIEGYQDDFYVPTVKFDAETGLCEISGESYLEETVQFYTPILKWIEEFLKTQKKPIIFNFNLTYFNTSSSKRILDILRLLKDYEDKGGIVTANWYYEEGDIDSVDDVEDFMLVSKLDVNLIEYPAE